MIFPVIFAALYASHFTLLRLPYYWDEAGYYIPAAWDFFRTGSLIPITTLTNAHPPLPSIYLALWWKLSGFYPEVTREAVLMVAALGLLAVWRLAMRLVGVPAVAFWTVAADRALPHLVCAEHAGPRGHLCRRLHAVGAGLRAAGAGPQALGRGAVVCRRRAVKETAIAIPLTLAAGEPGGGLRVRPPARFRLLARGGVARELRAAAGRLVRLALRQDRISLRQSRVSALQRAGHARPAADSGRLSAIACCT
jgi:hypothetical protein